MKSKKIMLVVVASSIALVSCKKKNLESSEDLYLESSLKITDAQPGSWWLYEWHKIDSTGTSVLTGDLDSVYCLGLKNINGYNYTHLRGTYFIYNDTFDYYLRDSLQFIINENGEIHYSSLGDYDSVQTSTGGSYSTYKLIEPFQGSYSVPAGTFNDVRKNETHYYTINGSSFTPCSFFWNQDNFYSVGVGELSSKCGFFGELNANCSYYERRLINYQIVY